MPQHLKGLDPDTVAEWRQRVLDEGRIQGLRDAADWINEMRISCRSAAVNGLRKKADEIEAFKDNIGSMKIEPQGSVFTPTEQTGNPVAEAAQAVFTIKYLPEGETDKRNASIRTIIGAEDAYECLHILREARLVVLDFCEYETTIPAALSSLTQGTE